MEDVYGIGVRVSREKFGEGGEIFGRVGGGGREGGAGAECAQGAEGVERTMEPGMPSVLCGG